MKLLLKFSIPIFLTVTTLFTLVGCSTDSSDTEPAKEITFADVEKVFSELDIKTGINDFSLDVPGNLKWDFRIIAPDVSDGIKKPLFVHLHGAAGGSPTAHMTTACYMEPGLENIDAYVISPNGGLSFWHEPVNQSQVMGLVTYALEYLDIDPNKVVIVGYSNGGNGSWFFAETRPQVFSAGIPMASSYNTTGTNGQSRKIDTPLYVIHGEDDALFPLADTQAWVNGSVEVGSTIEFVVAQGLEHQEPCEYVSYLQDAVEWVKTEVWPE